MSRFHRWVDERFSRGATSEQIEASKTWSGTWDYLRRHYFSSSRFVFDLAVGTVMAMAIFVIAVMYR